MKKKLDYLKDISDSYEGIGMPIEALTVTPQELKKFAKQGKKHVVAACPVPADKKQNPPLPFLGAGDH